LELELVELLELGLPDGLAGAFPFNLLLIVLVALTLLISVFLSELLELESSDSLQQLSLLIY